VIEPARPGRRRRYSAEDKRRIVEETRTPGQSVSSVSRRYGVSPSQVFKWRRLVEEGTSARQRALRRCQDRMPRLQTR
jgi:transposase